MALSEPVAVNRAERTLITPEGVDLRLKIADAGQRASAFLLDLAIIVGVLIYGLAAFALRAVTLSEIKGALRREKGVAGVPSGGEG